VNPSMDAIISQVQALAKTADEAGRKKLVDDGLRDLSYSLETPQDTAQRVMFGV
jgi:demethylsterigmatocystin 6-O-methyltransferase